MASKIHSPILSQTLTLTLDNLPLSLPMETSPSSSPSLTQTDLKRLAAHHAADLVRSGMILGLGTGSTASLFLDRLSFLLRRGSLHNIICIPTSKQTELHALSLNIPLSDLDSHPLLDLSIDGADQVDLNLNLIKGRGGSLLREKMVEGASKRFVVIVDESKVVNSLGKYSGLAVPVEIVPFCAKFTMEKLRRVFDGVVGFDLRLRTISEDEISPAVTDNLNYVVDMFFEKGIGRDLEEVSDEILRIVGVVEHGMFLGMASSVIVAGRDGSVRVMNRVGDGSGLNG